VFRKNEELFQENSWVQVMLGQGIVPRAHHPIANKLSDAELSGLLSGIRDNVARTVRTLPGHQDYIGRYCDASEADAA
jgi:tryptophan halogenase